MKSLEYYKLEYILFSKYQMILTNPVGNSPTIGRQGREKIEGRNEDWERVAGEESSGLMR